MPNTLSQARPKIPDLSEDWRGVMRNAITSVEELCDMLEIPCHYKENFILNNPTFTLKVPRSFVAKMQLGNIHDPLLKQIIPLSAENKISAGYASDPVADLKHIPENGIIHKYFGRALLITTGACAVHCRYCFRREFPYTEQNAAAKQWQRAIQYIQQDNSIHEVILSGGDPLSLSDEKISSLLILLNDIEHIKTIRFHTRQPIVLPERITKNLLKTLKLSDKKLVFVVHSNHANELCSQVKTACNRLLQMGVRLLNQSVLLRNINDTDSALIALSHRLHELDIQPYYLNILDKVSGSEHFAVEDDKIKDLNTKIRLKLPGYLVPRFVRDDGNSKNKSILF